MKKKIVYISRLFSGFQQGIDKNNWKPSGATTIFKFFDYAKSRSNLDIFFTKRDNQINNFLIEKRNIKNFVKDSWVVKFPIKKNPIIDDIKNIYYNLLLFFEILKRKPSIIYATNQNLILAVMFKVLTNIPIVLRVMGIFDVMRDKKNYKDKIFQLFYKIKFNLVVITEDGSGTEEWANEYLNNKSKKLILINGVDKKKKIKKNRTYKSDILFVGRLEDGKGIIEFVKNIIFLNKKRKVKVNIIGSGPQRNTAYKILKKHKVDFNILENIPHKKIFNYYKNSKVYVSLNTRGNISNTNLEAFSSSCAMLLPTFKKPLSKIIDNSTRLIFDEKSVFYFKFYKKYDLAEKIILLLENNQIRKSKRKKLDYKKKYFLNSWNDRMKQEFEEIVKI